jgi:hypothetical protein
MTLSIRWGERNRKNVNVLVILKSQRPKQLDFAFDIRFKFFILIVSYDTILRRTAQSSIKQTLAPSPHPPACQWQGKPKWFL